METTEQKIREILGDKYPIHYFDVGYNRCSFCNEPRFLVDRKVLNTIVAEEGIGSSREVTETVIDQTKFPCENNPFKPLTLPDVLRAVVKVNPANKTLVTMESDGQFVIDRINLKCTWNLTKDWSGQTQEVKDFIGGIIK